MTFSLLGLLLYLVIAAICGSIGRAIAGGTRGGLLTSIVLGFIGALFGGWISRQAGLPEPFLVMVGGHPFPVVWSVIGAALFVAVIHLIARPRL